MPVPVAKKQARYKGLSVPAPATQVGAAASPAPAPPKGVVRPPTPTPPAPVYGAAPPTAQGQAIRSDSQVAMSGANTDWRDSVYRAVMGLGDPTQIAKYQQNPDFAGYNFVVDPNSTYSQLDRGQQDAYKGIDNGAVQGNTFFSGLRLNDRDDARQNFDFQRAGATHTFEDALADYARTLAAAKLTNTQANNQANSVDFDAANAIDPVAASLPGNMSKSLTASQFAAKTKKAKKKGK